MKKREGREESDRGKRSTRKRHYILQNSLPPLPTCSSKDTVLLNSRVRVYSQIAFITDLSNEITLSAKLLNKVLAATTPRPSSTTSIITGEKVSVTSLPLVVIYIQTCCKVSLYFYLELSWILNFIYQCVKHILILIHHYLGRFTLYRFQSSLHRGHLLSGRISHNILNKAHHTRLLQLAIITQMVGHVTLHSRDSNYNNQSAKLQLINIHYQDQSSVQSR